ncbi:MAG TPA: hypothetical protein VMB77_07525 [Syntrophales bacterium]|nr:hypothetical protein [Syntrophales bacterium]
MRRLIALLVIGSGALLAADLCASAPVKVNITGCVTGGVLISERTDFGTHTSEGKSRINTLAPGGAPLDLAAHEGKRISIAGQILPGDRFYGEASSIQVLGLCVSPSKKDLPKQITDDEADEIAWALPEVQGMIKRMEGTKAAPFSMITGYPDPNAEPGRPGAYYEIYVGERYETHTVRVLTLIVDAYSGKVSVYDAVADRVVPIEEYRKKVQK